MTVLKTPESIAEHSSAESVVKHVDLWNHNVEFIEEDSAWSRPAVFVEFAPIVWSAVQGRVEYTTRARVLLHVVTDWCGSASAGSEFQAESLGVFDLLDALHELLEDFGGASFDHLKLVESRTNHNHEDIVENVEVFEYRGKQVIG
ncbi:MAG: hypothetical protein J6T94_02820 [Bacteroidaceae bacterium]|nr:hypothetical protein [Bacteroidaceae bacterium]